MRRLIDEATDLSVRAANGTTSATLGSTMNVSNSMFGGSAAALGLGSGNAGAHAKLSRERKHRMRELATQKLSQAYYLDEIAASVATMQGASSLEEVAKFVLQRQPDDCNAKYVHFFHEKIPSRMMAQYTDFKLLDEIIQSRPMDGAPLRTRAVTKLFKDDYEGALRDLTEALRIHRRISGPHQNGKGTPSWLEQTALVPPQERSVRHRHNEPIPDEANRPSGLDAQMLFHRGGVYLTLACLSVQKALSNPKQEHQQNGSEPGAAQIEAQRSVKVNAKRALRDYMSFLSHFEYTPGLTIDAAAELVERLKSLASDIPGSEHENAPFTSRSSVNGSHQNGVKAQQLMPCQNGDSSAPQSSTNPLSNPHPSFTPPKVYLICDLFAPAPLTDLPPYPPQSDALVTQKAGSQQRQQDALSRQIQAYADRHEVVSYHPLLTDALHSLLLCHSILQTPTKEFVRHAHMVARLTRICDGYPVFLAARSPSRSDWMHLNQRLENWLGLTQSWEDLCAPPPLPGYPGSNGHNENPELVRERRRHDAIVEALADERVHDTQSFQAAVNAREPGSGHANGTTPASTNTESRQSMQEDGRDYSVGTDRAEVIAKWIKEAPDLATLAANTKKGTKNKIRKVCKKTEDHLSELA